MDDEVGIGGWSETRLACHICIGHVWQWPTWCSINMMARLIPGTTFQHNVGPAALDSWFFVDQHMHARWGNGHAIEAKLAM